MTEAANPNAAETAATAQRPTHGAGVGVVKKTTGSYNVDPRTITTREGWNVRFDMGDLDELARSISAQLKRDPESGGLIHPLGLKRIAKDDPLGQGGKFLFEVVRGHRRTAAIQALLKKGTAFLLGVPAKILDKDIDQQEALLEMFVENTGKPLLPIEQAAAFKRLRDGDPAAGVRGMSLKEIEKATGFSDNTINASLALLEADEEVIQAVKDKKVSASTAKEIAVHARGDKAKQRELIAAAKTAKTPEQRRALKKAIETQQRAKHAAKGKTLKMRALSDADLSALGSKLAGEMAAKMKDAGRPLDTDLRAWVAKDEKLTLAFTYGALEALKAAAGMKIDLSI